FGAGGGRLLAHQGGEVVTGSGRGPAQHVPGPDRARPEDLVAAPAQRVVVVEQRLQRRLDPLVRGPRRGLYDGRLVEAVGGAGDRVEPGGDRRGRHRPRAVAGPDGPGPPGGAGDERQRLRGAVHEDVLRGDREARLPCPGDQLDGTDAVAAAVAGPRLGTGGL